MSFSSEQFEEMSKKLADVRAEIGKFIVGQQEAVEFSLYSILSDGHALLEGLPGLGKTMLIRTISEVLDLSFSRIQFTPDLMPADITGTSILERSEDGVQRFVFKEGPIFSQMVLADEINRATPKTQSALLEAMGEKTVTVLGETRKMAKPFFVLATQNPIEMEGTYPLPEAQMDRFLCKVLLPYPSKEELKEIMLRTTGPESIAIRKVMNTETIVEAQEMAKAVVIADDMIDYAVDLVSATHHKSGSEDEWNQYVQYGSGPRGLQSIIRLAKARALMAGRVHVSIADIKTVAKPALRHRILINYEGEAEGIDVDKLIDKLLEEVRQGASIQ
ncbi:MoxR family ATPase [Sporosarcina thermotolerans]|uniref:MoxR family ATPase n=1 Tax=Sporosarcina thermotolerans TaxID=633404 RepID=A0AAW9A3X9_9BACL|nr:MoxR family ATPase [Sporosarcina thermotolerans]MDW0115891.1 MoxR family ATPase [Sporosarcina thermotolerans]WHT46889.1 MoxR family ATPase [Sporosarcina thermotolerans]